MQKIISFGFIFIGICMALLAVPPEVETLQVAMEANSFESTTAYVTDLRTKSHPKGPSTEILEFDYEVDGRTYHGDNHLTQFDDSREELGRLIRWKNGERYLEVHYDPDDPRRVVAHRDMGVLVPIGVLGITAACLYGGIQGYLEDRRMKQRALEREERQQESA